MAGFEYRRDDEESAEADADFLRQEAAVAPPPRVLIVSRRTVRKNKFVDFVGEYHLDLLVNYGVVPVIVPRVCGLQSLLDGYEPIHGVLLCEGEDVDPNLYYDGEPADLTDEEMAEIRRLHSSDVAIDKDKDSIELHLARCCLGRGIPILGICRGSQILNVACGGSLYQDVEIELCQKKGVPIKHLNYDDYDGHRHPINVVQETPLHEWFRDSLEQLNMVMDVNSYHHQGVKRLACRFKPMAFSPCGLIEAYYDVDYNPGKGKFTVGLQFHPERMRRDQVISMTDSSCLVPHDTFDYPGCVKVYKEFAKAVIAYQKTKACRSMPNSIIMDDHVENRTHSLDLAERLLVHTGGMQSMAVGENAWALRSMHSKCQATSLRMERSSCRSSFLRQGIASLHGESHEPSMNAVLKLQQKSVVQHVDLTFHHRAVAKISMVHTIGQNLKMYSHTHPGILCT